MVGKVEWVVVLAVARVQQTPDAARLTVDVLLASLAHRVTQERTKQVRVRVLRQLHLFTCACRQTENDTCHWCGEIRVYMYNLKTINTLYVYGYGSTVTR